MAPHERFRFRSAEDLLEKARSLNVDIPFSPDPAALFDGARLDGLTLPNRAVVLPLEGCDADPEGRPTEMTFRRYRRFAQGGSGLIWFEATAVVPEGRSNPHQLVLGKATLDGFKRLVEETRRAGGGREGQGAGTALILQLTHAGRFARTGKDRAPVIAGHNPHLDERLGIPADHPLIPDAELDRLMDGYVGAARLAAEAGFSGVDVKACHAYLLSDLLAAFTRKDSRFGGAFENRVRFLLETVCRIRSEVPGMIIASRLGIHDGLPHPYGFGVDRDDPGKPDFSEPRALIGSLAAAGATLIGLSLGTPFLQPHLSRPYDKPQKGGELPDEHPLEGIARALRITALFQREFPKVSFVGSAYSWLRSFWPQVAAGALETGGASLIGLGRSSLAYPDAVADLAGKGKLDRRRVCTTCSRCSRLLSAGMHVGCPIQDRDVYEREYSALRKLARLERRA